MAETPYKLMIFLKRRPGLSVEAFREYYETSHAKLCERYMAGVVRYVRRYVDALPDPETGLVEEMPFDVVTETWFADKAVFDAVVAAASKGLMPADVIEDEEKVFDRSKSRFAIVTEAETDCTRLHATG